MRLSEAGATLIAEFEGFRSCPYRDAVGVWTIGYGSTRGVGPKTPCMTQSQALARMQSEVNNTYGAAINALDLPLTQNQFDALVSFVYNVGPGGVGARSTVGKLLRAHDWKGAADALLAWNKAQGRVLAGLTRRRQAERTLFLKTDPETARWAHYTESERRWITEYDRLVKAKKDVARRRVLRRVMEEQRKRIWRVAQPKAAGGDGRGWSYANRSARYRSLLARTR